MSFGFGIAVFRENLRHCVPRLNSLWMPGFHEATFYFDDIAA